MTSALICNRPRERGLKVRGAEGDGRDGALTVGREIGDHTDESERAKTFGDGQEVFLSAITPMEEDEQFIRGCRMREESFLFLGVVCG